MSWQALNHLLEKSTLSFDQQFSLSKYRVLLDEEQDIKVIREVALELKQQLMQKENIITAMFSKFM